MTDAINPAAFFKLGLNQHIVVSLDVTMQLFRPNYFLHINVFVRISVKYSSAKLLYSAQYSETPTQTVETVWRHQTINTQCGVVRFRLYPTMWSERIVMGRAVVRLWWVTVTPVSCGFTSRAPHHHHHHLVPSPLLPGYQMTIAMLWPCSQVETFTDKHVTGTVKTMSSRPCRRTLAEPHGQAGPAHCSLWVRVLPGWPRPTAKHCWPMLKDQRSTVYVTDC